MTFLSLLAVTLVIQGIAMLVRKRKRDPRMELHSYTGDWRG